ncbi:MAG TPA: glutamate formimidoyltransferase [Candidatus Acidoferrum sp.]|nr:glutamate formimidoyltransferase [Candidatus Acidoferrum sp.]
MLLAVPNFSEGRKGGRIDAISSAFATGATLLDTHSDSVHNRTVLTLSAPPRSLGDALVRGARACVEELDMRRQDGAHPRIGALDVCPVVWLSEGDREPAREAALTVARRIGAEAEVPVFLYGELAAHPARRERAFFREGGLVELGARMASGELRPDFGPAKPHPTAGATLVTARPPLAAFNLALEGAEIDDARAIASRLREAGGGLQGVRAIGIELEKGRTQVSTNVHDPIAVPLARVVERVRELADAYGASIASAEIVGLIPEPALADWPEDIPLPGFDPSLHVIERRVQVD